MGHRAQAFLCSGAFGECRALRFRFYGGEVRL